MKKLAKKDLHLMGSAGSLDALKEAIIKRCYWNMIDTAVSKTYESRLGAVYDVINGNGLCDNLVIICGKNGRWSFYRINDEAV